MANGYDPGAFDVIREEYQRDDRDRDRFREEERRLSEQRDIDRDRLREDDRDADAQRLADDLLRELEKLNPVDGEMAFEDLRDKAVEMDDEFLELGLAKLSATRPRNLANERRRRGIRGPGRQTIRRSGQFRRDMILPRFKEEVSVPKKKRKVSKYQMEFGKQLKKLVKKHPRTKITRLMKRAHSATRKAMK